MSVVSYLNESLVPSCGCCANFHLHIDESDGEILDIKKYDLKGRFDYWNEKLFDGKLPMVDKIGFASLKSKGSTGITNAKIEYADGSKKTFSKVWDSKIILTTLVKFNQTTLDQILVHEMIHWYFIGVKMVNEDHGRQFKQMASNLGRACGFEIPLIDTITEFEDRLDKLPEVGCVLFDIEGRNNVMFTSKTKFDEKIADLSKTLKGYSLPSGSTITFGLCKFPRIHEYTQLRSYKKLKMFKISAEDANTIKWTNGNLTKVEIAEF